MNIPKYIHDFTLAVITTHTLKKNPQKNATQLEATRWVVIERRPGKMDGAPDQRDTAVCLVSTWPITAERLGCTLPDQSFPSVYARLVRVGG